MYRSDAEVETVLALMRRAMEAIKRYHLAGDACAPSEIERLRAEAESLIRSAQEYQDRMFEGHPS